MAIIMKIKVQCDLSSAEGLGAEWAGEGIISRQYTNS